MGLATLPKAVSGRTRYGDRCVTEIQQPARAVSVDGRWCRGGRGVALSVGGRRVEEDPLRRAPEHTAMSCPVGSAGLLQKSQRDLTKGGARVLKRVGTKLDPLRERNAQVEAHMVAVLTLGLIGSAALGSPPTVSPDARDFLGPLSEVQRVSVPVGPLGGSVGYRMDARGHFRVPRSRVARGTDSGFGNPNPLSTDRHGPALAFDGRSGWGVLAPVSTGPLRVGLFTSDHLASLAPGFRAQTDFRLDTGTSVDSVARRQVHHGRMSASRRPDWPPQAKQAWGPCWGCDEVVGAPYDVWGETGLTFGIAHYVLGGRVGWGWRP